MPSVRSPAPRRCWPIYHMFNGIRVALVGMGVAHRQQRGLFYGLVGFGLVLFVVGAVLIFTK